MPHAIEGDRLILKILDEGVFQIGVLITLQQDVERLDDYLAKELVGGGDIASQVNLGIAAAAQTVFDVVTTVDPAL
jgi:hypothetical protein